MPTMPDKKAKTQYDVLPVIRERWSPRGYDPDAQVEPEKLATMLEAARWAASSYNEQPWRFFVGDKHRTPRAYQQLLSCLVPANQAWADRAPVLLLACAKRHFSQNGSPNRHGWHDVGLAMGNLSLQGQSLGIYTHMMAGFSAETAERVLSIPPEYEPVVMATLGYPGSANHLPDWAQLAEVAPRERKPLQEIVFSTDWGQPFPGIYS
jgi:nitroreductase